VGSLEFVSVLTDVVAKFEDQIWKAQRGQEGAKRRETGSRRLSERVRCVKRRGEA